MSRHKIHSSECAYMTCKAETVRIYYLRIQLYDELIDAGEMMRKCLSRLELWIHQLQCVYYRFP